MSSALQAIFRIAAVLLLFVAAADLIACEMLYPESCESFGYPSPDDSSGDDDNCICCCAHILVSEPFTLEASSDTLFLPTTTDPALPLSRTFTLYHPPRA